MAFLLRKKLVCFYCGYKSAQTRTPNLRRWQCAHCEAENFLDEKGEITDPPAESVPSNARYAQSLARPSLPGLETPDDSLFCPTCLKNQHLVSQALASYLPSPDAPDYAEYEKAEGEYLKGLEERYPQVCRICEPKVQERIRAAGYAAKTDHLRRIMDRTRGYGIQYRDASWGASLVTLGGIGWFLSLAGQIIWDSLSLFEFIEESRGVRDAHAFASSPECLQRVMRGSGSISDCSELLYSVAGLALLLGLLSSWWNPMMKEALRRKGARAVGTADFYKSQGLFLSVRCFIWWFLPGYRLSVQMNAAAHLSLLVLATIITVTAFRSVRMEYSAPVKFQDSPVPPVFQTTQQKTSDIGTEHIGNCHLQTNSSNTRSNGGPRPFSVMDFAPPSQRLHTPVYQPPTPPPDDDGNETMDWTPSQENKVLRPALSYRTSSAVSQQPQLLPYRETDPANAINGLRNLSNQHVFHKDPETRTRTLYTTPKKNNMRDSYDESPFNTPYEPSRAAGSPELSPTYFAQPRFFPHADREDLGLESLMANNFSLAETPREVRARQQQFEKCRNEIESGMDDMYAQWNGPAALFLLAISCMVWTSTPLPYLAAFRVRFRLAPLCIAALAILKSLLPAVWKKSDRRLRDIVLLAFELITTIMFGAVLRERAATSALEDGIGPLETPGLILIATLIAQEAFILYSGKWDYRRSNGRVPSPPVLQPAAAPSVQDRLQPLGSSMSLSKPDPDTGTGTALRSRTRFQNDTRTPGGFNSLSLGGDSKDEQALGINSLTLGHSQRSNRNGR